MAGEFQTHVDEMVKEADLADVKKSFNEIKNFDLKSVVEKAIDPDNTLRDTFAGDPLAPSEAAAGENAEPAPPPPPEFFVVEPPPRAPAFIPPGLIPPEPVAVAEPEGPPPFVPPQFADKRASA